MTSSLPPACRQTGACRGSGARYAFRPPERSYLDVRRSRRPEASGHRIERLGRLLCDEPVEPGPGRVPINPHGILGHGSIFWFSTAVLSF